MSDDYLTPFRDPRSFRPLVDRIFGLAESIAAPVRIMEVCGTHTMAIARFGLKALLPTNVKLVSGPGCPVCVTPSEYVDRAIALSLRPDTVVCTFGDMIRVPGGKSSLALARSEGGGVRVVYSAHEALKTARRETGKTVVFLGVGFETTAPTIGAMLLEALDADVRNLLVLDAFKTVPEALMILASDPEQKLSGFLCPAHVSAIIGARAYEPVAAAFRLPCVVTGFEPTDILYGILGVLEQIAAHEGRVDNRYERVVKYEGNKTALAVLDKVFAPADAEWRGIGTLPKSGLTLRPPFDRFSAALKLDLAPGKSRDNPACRCGDILKGKLEPEQ